MNDDDEIRKKLTEQLNNLSARVKEIEGDLSLPLDDDFAEQAIQREDDQTLDALEHAALEEISRIEAALRRLDLGTYGLCTVCSNAIAVARLDALPAAAQCARCAGMTGSP